METYQETAVRINNVICYEINGQRIYLGWLNSFHIERLLRVPHIKISKTGFEDYQRPENKRRSKNFATFLTRGTIPFVTPITLNARGNWDFSLETDCGYLLCNGKANIVDGQHRIRGILRWLAQTQSNIGVPFIAYDHLTEEEEKELFYIINSEARPITKSHQILLESNTDPLAWISRQLLTDSVSPFYPIGTVLGQRNRNKGIHITLQNIQKSVSLLSKYGNLNRLTKDAHFQLTLYLFNKIYEMFQEAWENYDDYRLTHTVGINALSIAAGMIFKECVSEQGDINYRAVDKAISGLTGFDWSVERWGQLSGMSGAEEMSRFILAKMASGLISAS